MRYLFYVLPLLIISSTPAASQPLRALVDSQDYVFQVQSYQPPGDIRRYLTTSNYTVQVAGDKIISDLPYLGREYFSSVDPTHLGWQFTSEKFEYTLSPGKKDGWTVLIKPKDNQDIRGLRLNISSTGYAKLEILSNSRELVTLDGIVAAPDNR
jgi:hypothetical protein